MTKYFDMFEGINQIKFSEQFNSNEDCFLYLVEQKWGKGFVCKRCANTTWYKGKTYCYRRCKKCLYDESATSNTLFHDLKMPLLKAFQMTFRIACKKKGMSTVELGAEVGVQQKTAWFFKKKLQIAMQPDSKDVLKKEVEVDETLIGGYLEGKPGRSLEGKEAVLVGIEKIGEDQVGNIRLTQIEDFEADTLKIVMEETIDPKAQITTDQFPSYESLKKEMPNLKTKKSEKGKAFEQLHQQIMLFKLWLRGIHHKCSSTHLQSYLDEYVFRFNHRNCRQRIFDILIRKIMHLQPHPFPVKKKACALIT